DNVKESRGKRKNCPKASPHAQILTECIASPFDQDIKFVDSGDKSHACYDRQEFMDFSSYSLPLSEEMQRRIDDIGIARASNTRPLVELAQNPCNSSEVLRGSEAVKSENKPSLDPTVEKKKYKFVPTTKRISYMRGQLLSYRDSMDETAWRQYALSKYDMSDDPFLRSDRVFDREKEQENASKDLISWRSVGTTAEQENATKDLISSSSEQTTADHKEALGKSNRLRYSRKDLIAIQNRIPKNAWLSYVKGRWNTSEEPFQLDSYMRCSFEEQLRRKRLLEKEQRAEVMKNRLKAQLEKPKVLASARTYARTPVVETCFDSFCDRLSKEFREYQGKRAETSCDVGPVVPVRDPPELWVSRVNYYTGWLRNFDSTFMYDVYKESGRKCEVATEVNFEECHYSTRRSRVQAENGRNNPDESDYGEDLLVPFDEERNECDGCT
ncbi:DEAD/DEAH box helicase, partial [Parelaphostrongylus tenuis]